MTVSPNWPSLGPLPAGPEKMSEAAVINGRDSTQGAQILQLSLKSFTQAYLPAEFSFVYIAGSWLKSNLALLVDHGHKRLFWEACSDLLVHTKLDRWVRKNKSGANSGLEMSLSLLLGCRILASSLHAASSVVRQ